MSRKPYLAPMITPHGQNVVNQLGQVQSERVQESLDGVPVARLLAEYGSPLFVYSERTLRQKARELRSAFTAAYPRVRLLWSYKTNYLDAICGVLHQEGWDAEVVSELEYAMARRLGIPGTRIVCNGAHKPRRWLERAVSEGAFVQLDHFDELLLLEDVARARGEIVPVGIRVNLRARSLGGAWERFGFHLESGEALDAALRVCQSPWLRLRGVHCHLGTFIPIPNAYAESARALGRLLKNIEAQSGEHLEVVNLGGGFPSGNTLMVPPAGADDEVTFADFAAAISSELRSCFQGRAELPELWLESGRALVDDAGSLLSTVVGTRRQPGDVRGLVLDAGLNVLYTAHWYRHRIIPAQPVAGPEVATVFFGPLCMNIDALAGPLPMPPLVLGDQLVIACVGAYNNTQWMQFSQPRPAVVMVAEDGAVEVIRRAEGIEDVKGPESLPARYAPPKYE
jgi:diaminopimelate decarboxylase